MTLVFFTRIRHRDSVAPSRCSCQECDILRTNRKVQYFVQLIRNAAETIFHNNLPFHRGSKLLGRVMFHQISSIENNISPQNNPIDCSATLISRPSVTIFSLPFPPPPRHSYIRGRRSSSAIRRNLQFKKPDFCYIRIGGLINDSRPSPPLSSASPPPSPPPVLSERKLNGRTGLQSPGDTGFLLSTISRR